MAQQSFPDAIPSRQAIDMLVQSRKAEVRAAYDCALFLQTRTRTKVLQPTVVAVRVSGLPLASRWAKDVLPLPAG